MIASLVPFLNIPKTLASVRTGVTKGWFQFSSPPVDTFVQERFLRGKRLHMTGVGLTAVGWVAVLGASVWLVSNLLKKEDPTIKNTPLLLLGGGTTLGLTGLALAHKGSRLEQEILVNTGRVGRRYLEKILEQKKNIFAGAIAVGALLGMGYLLVKNFKD